LIRPNPPYSRCRHDYDPRRRPWYTRFVAENIRQVIFLFDQSSSLSDTLINGEPYTTYVRTIAKKIEENLKYNDLVFGV